MYDGQLGRWHVVDPASEEADQESWSPYHYVYCDPIRHNDPDGKTGNPITGALQAMAIEYGTQVIVNLATGKENPFSDVDLADIAVAGAVGALSSGLNGGFQVAAASTRIAKAIQVGKALVPELAKASVDVKYNKETKKFDKETVGGVVGKKKDLKNAAVDVIAGPGGGLVGKQGGRAVNHIINEEIAATTKAMTKLRTGGKTFAKKQAQVAEAEGQKKARENMVNVAAGAATSYSGEQVKDVIK